MNYIELNGVRNTIIQGLMIQELPPISKPLMRTSIEEIEGRDGDIVTKLGYSAYDKELTIGVFGNYDINEIIKYFDSEGTVIFSNEPDKYYKYQILEQIDFERLGRFRSATVTFHVQPYKYSAVNETRVKQEDLNNILTFKSYEEKKSGVTIKAIGETTLSIKVTPGIGSRTFIVPIETINVPLVSMKQYTLSLTASDMTGVSGMEARLCYSTSAEDYDSFGGQAVALSTGTETLTAYGPAPGQTVPRTSYSYLIIEGGAGAGEFTLDVAFIDTGTAKLQLVNFGNIYSRPSITFKAATASNLTLAINDETIAVISGHTVDDVITLDGETMNAYKDGALFNRKVSGDLEYLRLSPGKNVITITTTSGDAVSEISIKNESRWI